MLAKINKAWVSALVAFISMTVANFFGFELSAEVQAAIIAVIIGFFTWLVPNKPAE